MIIEKTAKISSKGQITLPKAIRDRLQSDLVRIIVEDDVIRIEPVRDVGASLHRYTREHIPHAQARDRAWTDAVEEKHPRR